MENILNTLIPSVNAQADAVAQPTFGLIDIGNGSTITGQVFANSSSTEVEVGQEFTVRVEINTNDVQIEEYRVVLAFDSLRLQVVDVDSETSGVQVGQLDQVFLPEDIAVDNVTNNNLGIISYRAAVDTPLAVNTEVIEITFQAQSAGAAIIEVQEGASGTQLVRQAGQGLTFTPNQVTVQVNTEAQNPDPVNPQNPGQNPSQPTPGQPIPQQPDEIPDTALSPELISLLPALLGLILVSLGVVLGNGGSKEKKK